MKTTIKTTMKTVGMAILMVVLSYTTSFAFKDSIKVNNNKSFSLVIDKFSSGARISFFDKRNNALYEQSINADSSFAKLFNLELLQKGEYFIRIEDEMRKKEIHLSINEEGISFDSTQIREFYKPVVREKGDWIFVNQFSPNGDPLYIAIYDRYNHLVHEDKLEGNTSLGKIYDFSQSMPGSYRVYLESEGVAMSRNVMIK
jgi:hypothetical protein